VKIRLIAFAVTIGPVLAVTVGLSGMDRPKRLKEPE
jgi:hypothetical protein